MNGIDVRLFNLIFLNKEVVERRTERCGWPFRHGLVPRRKSFEGYVPKEDRGIKTVFRHALKARAETLFGGRRCGV